jgi:hypothetical protein
MSVTQLLSITQCPYKIIAPSERVKQVRALCLDRNRNDDRHGDLHDVALCWLQEALDVTGQVLVGTEIPVSTQAYMYNGDKTRQTISGRLDVALFDTQKREFSVGELKTFPDTLQDLASLMTGRASEAQTWVAKSWNWERKFLKLKYVMQMGLYAAMLESALSKLSAESPYRDLKCGTGWLVGIDGFNNELRIYRIDLRDKSFLTDEKALREMFTVTHPSSTCHRDKQTREVLSCSFPRDCIDGLIHDCKKT